MPRYEGNFICLLPRTHVAIKTDRKIKQPEACAHNTKDDWRAYVHFARFIIFRRS